MKTGMNSALLRLLDTYGLTYAFTALLLVPGLVAADRFGVEKYSAPYLAALSIPFVLGPAVVFLLDSRDGLRTVAIRSAVLSPIVALTGVLIVFLAMIVIVLPLSWFVIPRFPNALAGYFIGSLALLAVPMVVSLVGRAREGMDASNVLQSIVLLAGIALVISLIAMTVHGASDALKAFLREDILKQYIATFSWYLPSLALAAGLWRRVGLV